MSLYAATKRANELFAYSYSNLYGLRTTGLRLFTVYGPWGRPDMAIYKFTRAMLAGEPIDVFNHGRLQRDFVYVDDVVEGIVQAERRQAAQVDPANASPPSQLYNLGHNQPIELAHADLHARRMSRGEGEDSEIWTCNRATCSRPGPTLNRARATWVTARTRRCGRDSSDSSRGIANTTVARVRLASGIGRLLLGDGQLLLRRSGCGEAIGQTQGQRQNCQRWIRVTRRGKY